MLSRYSWVASDNVSTGAKYRGEASGLDEDLAVANDDRIDVDVFRCWERQHATGAKVEVCAVAGALDLEPLATALAERPVIVAAAVLDRVVRPVDQIHAHEQRAGLDDLHSAFGDLPLG